MAYQQIALDLAATFYAASLLPDPMIESQPRPTARTVFRDKGQELASSFFRPQRQAEIVCTCRASSTRPDRPARIIAAVHDRDLVVVRGPRGPSYAGHRLRDHFLIDLGIARRDGFTSTSVWCYRCGGRHELDFEWLQQANQGDFSTPDEQYQIAWWGEPITPQGYTPRHRDDANRLAFATTTGRLDRPTLIVTLGWLYAFAYRDHFGFKPPHEAHLLRLIGNGDSRVEQPRLEELLTPQWRQLQKNPELRAEERIEGPIPAEAIEALARYLWELDAPDREDELLTFEQLMDQPDFDQLKGLLTQEAR